MVRDEMDNSQRRRRLRAMRVNEYLRIGVDAKTEMEAIRRARELWKEFGLPENFRMSRVEKLVPQNRYEISLVPDVEGL